MGKTEQQNLQRRPGGEHDARGDGGSSRFFCERCSVGLRRVAGEFSLRCVFVLVLGLAVFLSGIFWVLPLRGARSGFDVKDAVKLSATVQVSFRLEKPVSEIVMRIGRLEYDIYSEIGVPDTKVAVLSAHKSGSTNYTDVVFGVLSDQMNVPINQVSLSVLRSYLIDLFLRQTNLTVTASLFGQPSELQILKFPGGITVNPMQSASIWQIPQILFNFTLYQSIREIQENFLEFKEQLKYGLRLRSYENVYAQVTNMEGSTVASFVTIEASITSDLGSLLPQRLKQLAQIISGSPENLGLNNTVFGNVKGVSLSSYLKRTLTSGPPTPSPAPSPGFVPSASPYISPSYSPAPSPNLHPVPRCRKCEISVYFGYFFISSPRKMGPMSGLTADCTCGGSTIAPATSPFHSSPAQTPTALSPAPASHSPFVSPTSQHSPSFSPAPTVSIASPPVEDKGFGEGLVSPSLAPLQSSFAVPLSPDMWLLVYSTFLINLLGWLSS
ncbi:uncharacterized protein LOC115727209 [Rhodamnia argentea]|uniref:Uncharacterized protein LOC115727209 n=1 Tax=Rhodamnia argentea TaxID=178133 RepID=A0A8B8MT37_9MYRT|nr:uncharacterized protein LOC115727209 [Rhodamnia argentea]